MYRDDYVARAIYERARAWSRASFFMGQVFDADFTLRFTNGVIMSPVRNKGILVCDIEPGASPPHVELLLWEVNSPYSIVGWSYISGHLDAEKSDVPLNDHTREIQLYLNRLRRREEIMSRMVGRQAWRAAGFFRPDFEEIGKASGVAASTVRSFFDGKQVNDDAKEKILRTFNINPEELEAHLWGSGS